MATLTDAKDLIPYLTQLVPLLRGVLVDPVPEARSTAAKSLGGLVERLGETNFPTLIDTLLAVLKSPASGVDQQGAAQGLSEVLAGLGVDRLEGLLPTIIANTSSPRAYVREGHISLLIFLPATFGDRFSPYLGRIIQPVLSGLADDSDYVREASMKAGKMIVANHSTKAIDLLLPELELGLFDESWRIRQRFAFSFFVFSCRIRAYRAINRAVRYNWSETCCSVSRVSVGNRMRRKRERTTLKKEALRTRIRNELWSIRWVRNDGTEYSRHCTLFDKIRLVWSVKLRSTFGRVWCRTLLERFERFWLC